MFICKAQRKRFVAECRRANFVTIVCLSLAWHMFESFGPPLREFLHERSPIFAESFRQELGSAIGSKRASGRRAVFIELLDEFRLTVFALSEKRLKQSDGRVLSASIWSGHQLPVAQSLIPSQ
jgi:hypothetical protein